MSSFLRKSFLARVMKIMQEGFAYSIRMDFT